LGYEFCFSKHGLTLMLIKGILYLSVSHMPGLSNVCLANVMIGFNVSSTGLTP
jgi:hypothetical protein